MARSCAALICCVNSRGKGGGAAAVEALAAATTKAAQMPAPQDVGAAAGRGPRSCGQQQLAAHDLRLAQLRRRELGAAATNQKCSSLPLLHSTSILQCFKSCPLLSKLILAHSWLPFTLSSKLFNPEQNDTSTKGIKIFKRFNHRKCLTRVINQVLWETKQGPKLYKTWQKVPRQQLN